MKYTIISIGEENNKKKLYVLSKYNAIVGYTGDNKDIMKFKDYSKATQVMADYLCNYDNLFVIPVKLLPYICTEPNATDKEADCEAGSTDTAKVDKYYITVTVHDSIYLLSYDNDIIYYWTCVTCKDDITKYCLSVYGNDIEAYKDIARSVMGRISTHNDVDLEVYKVEDFINKISEKEEAPYYILLTIDTLHHGKNKYLLASRGKVYYYTPFTTVINGDSMRFGTIEEAKDLINRLNEPLARMAGAIATGYGTQRLEICSSTEILQHKESK